MVVRECSRVIVSYHTHFAGFAAVGTIVEAVIAQPYTVFACAHTAVARTIAIPFGLVAHGADRGAGVHLKTTICDPARCGKLQYI